jgi:hypothetical protein
MKRVSHGSSAPAFGTLASGSLSGAASPPESTARVPADVPAGCDAKYAVAGTLVAPQHGIASLHEPDGGDPHGRRLPSRNCLPGAVRSTSLSEYIESHADRCATNVSVTLEIERRPLTEYIYTPGQERSSPTRGWVTRRVRWRPWT